MNLLMFNMSNFVDWEEGVCNRNFFVARELIKRPEIDQVVLVDFLSIQPMKKVFGWKRTLDYGKKLFAWKKDEPSFIGQRIGLTHSLGQIKKGELASDKQVYVFQGLGLFTQTESAMSSLLSVIEPLGFRPSNTIIWSYNAFLPEAFDLSAKLKIFDAVDNWATHASYEKEAGKLMENYKRIDRQADLIFTVSEKLKDLFNNSQANWIPNGTDVSRFANAQSIELNFKKPIIGYVGTIQERLDFDLLQYVCNQHQEKSFVFIGPVWKGVQAEVEKLKAECGNVYFIGAKPYEQLPGLLKQIDVALIPHRLDAFIHSTNPMKMYDYLAAGKAVVTTPGAGTEMFGDVMSIKKDKESFSKAIDEQLANDNNDLREKRRQAVSKHDWSRRMFDMMEIINKHLLQ